MQIYKYFYGTVFYWLFSSNKSRTLAHKGKKWFENDCRGSISDPSIKGWRFQCQKVAPSLLQLAGHMYLGVRYLVRAIFTAIVPTEYQQQFFDCIRKPGKSNINIILAASPMEIPLTCTEVWIRRQLTGFSKKIWSDNYDVAQAEWKNFLSFGKYAQII